MKNSIDSTITDDFLLKHFKSPNKYQELTSDPPQSTLAVSEERFVAYVKELQQMTQGGGGITERNMKIALELYFTKYHVP